jgi:hypothetical protein
MPKPIDPLVAEIVEQLTMTCARSEERAGIVEYDGNVARAHAECLALLIVLQHHPEAIVGLIVLEMHASGETYWVLTNDRATARTYVSERGGWPTTFAGGDSWLIGGGPPAPIGLEFRTSLRCSETVTLLE